VKAAGLVLCLWWLLAVVHQLALLGLAGILRWTVWQDAVARLAVVTGADDVYSRLLVTMLATVEPKGIALWSPFAGELQSIGPLLLTPSSYLPAASWMGVMFATGSSAVGVHAIQLLVNLGMVALGTTLLGASHVWVQDAQRARWLSNPHARLASMLCVASGAGGELQLAWGSGSGGEMAFSMVATKILRMDRVVYDTALHEGQLLSIAMNLVGIVVAAAIGAVAALLVVRFAHGSGVLQRIKARSTLQKNWRAAMPATT